MKNTIKANQGYRVFKATHKITGEKYLIVKDGNNIILAATPRTFEEYLAEKRGNECFNICEIFTTANGIQYIYWRDEEIDADYLTKII